MLCGVRCRAGAMACVRAWGNPLTPAQSISPLPPPPLSLWRTCVCLPLQQFYSGERLLECRPAYYATGESPSLWFRPTEVWEVRGADLTISPVHRAAQGLVDESKGISIRFPRLVRVRDDKGIEDATTSEEVAELYNKQNRKRV